MKVWELNWDAGRLRVQSLGGMLTDVSFRLSSGRTVSPLHTPPWADEPESSRLPDLLRRFQGEWPCVPFGAARDVRNRAAGWSPVTPAVPDGPTHGYGANAHWDLVDRSSSEIAVEILYPSTHPVRRLRRRIRPRPGDSGVDLELEIEARDDVRIPIGLHPTFALSKRIRGTHLIPGAFRFGMTFPGDFEPGSYPLEAGATFSSLQSVPMSGGGALDLTRLPLESATEALVQLCGATGSFTLRHDDEYRVRLDWDALHFPSCVLWISNGGRAAYPWNSRHVAIGVEPVASAFDLGSSIATADNPIRLRGIPTSLQLRGDCTWRTEYSIRVH